MSDRLITSTSNQRIKDVAKLRDRRQRDKQLRFLIDGARELVRAISAGVELSEIFVCESLCHSDDAREVLNLFSSSSITRWDVTPQVFSKLAFGERAEGVLAVAPKPTRELAQLQLPDNPLVAVLEGVEKPGNLGAVLRSADAAGVSALIVADGRTDLFNPNAIRASLGTIFTVPLASASSDETAAWLRERNIPCYAARVEGALLYSEVAWRNPSAVILGSEAAGVSAVFHSSDITAIRIPMLGIADSLNVSATAAVLFYEALRQRSS
jgi:RNA methyltransferase, TrmH family